MVVVARKQQLVVEERAWDSLQIKPPKPRITHQPKWITVKCAACQHNNLVGILSHGRQCFSCSIKL